MPVPTVIRLPKLVLRHKVLRSLPAPWALAPLSLGFERPHCKDIVTMGTQEDSAAIFPFIAGTKLIISPPLSPRHNTFPPQHKNPGN